MNESTKTAAYRFGTHLAMCDVGLTKLAEEPGSEIWPLLFGPLGGGLAAPEGKGWEAAGKTWLGGMGGALGGGVGGLSLGALLSLLTKGKVPMGPATMAGGGLGALGGQGVGSVLGYRSAVE